MATLSEGFWQFFVIAVIGLLGACLRSIYTSKCSRMSFCGCVIERNIEAEVREDLAPRAEGENRPVENL